LQFVTNADVKQGVTSWLQIFDKDYLFIRVKAVTPL